MTENKEGGRRRFKQRFFVARELQLSMAVLVVLALLGGVFLQWLLGVLKSRYAIDTPAVGIFLIVGYAALVALLAVFFSHRLVGPFKRLEYEMKIIRAGELDRRLSIRSKDDLHIRNFVRYLNTFIDNFEEMSREYNKLNSYIHSALQEVLEELEKEPCDKERIKNRLVEIQREVHRLRERW